MKKFIFAILAVLVSVALVPGAGAGPTGFNGIKLTPNSYDDTYTIQAQNTSGVDVFTLTPAGVLTFIGTLDVSGATITLPGTRNIDFNLGGAMVDGTGPITSATSWPWHRGLAACYPSTPRP